MASSQQLSVLEVGRRLLIRPGFRDGQRQVEFLREGPQLGFLFRGRPTLDCEEWILVQCLGPRLFQFVQVGESVQALRKEVAPAGQPGAFRPQIFQIQLDFLQPSLQFGERTIADVNPLDGHPGGL